jgi:hypothetical protein
VGLFFSIFISMKLTDFLRENEEEDGMKGLAKTQYDLAIKPQNMDAALKALDNIQNYGIYAQNLRDPKVIAKVFGPSIPAQKTGAAWRDWDERTPEEKDAKIADIKSREPEAYQQAIEKSQKQFDDWITPGKNQTFDDYLKSLPGKQLPMEFYGKYGKNYFPMKTPDNLKKYAGKLEQDVHFVVQDDIILFPSNMENPYNTKPYLTKVLKTIMGNADVEHSIIKVERDVDGEREPEQIDTDKKDTVPPLSVTKDTRDEVEKVRKEFQKEIGEVPTAKYEIEPVESEEGRKYKLTVTGVSKDQRAKLFAKKMSLQEQQEFEKKQLMIRAGIIK